MESRTEADGKVFYDRLSEVMKTDSEMKVGDIVIYTNDPGLVFGPYEVLAFEKVENDKDRCIYIDYNSYWLFECCENLLLFRKG